MTNHVPTDAGVRRSRPAKRVLIRMKRGVLRDEPPCVPTRKEATGLSTTHGFSSFPVPSRDETGTYSTWALSFLVEGISSRPTSGASIRRSRGGTCLHRASLFTVAHDGATPLYQTGTCASDPRCKFPRRSSHVIRWQQPTTHRIARHTHRRPKTCGRRIGTGHPTSRNRRCPGWP